MYDISTLRVCGVVGGVRKNASIVPCVRQLSWLPVGCGALNCDVCHLKIGRERGISEVNQDGTYINSHPIDHLLRETIA